MKHLLFFIAFLPCFAQVSAQSCTGCTMTISSSSSAPITVGPGSTVCITSSANITGRIAINGGTLCNEGSIITSAVVLASGTFNNYGSVQVDSLTCNGGFVKNYNDLSAGETSVGASGKLENYASFGCDEFRASGSLALPTNSGTFYVSGEMMLGSGSTFNNSGTIQVGDDVIIDQGASIGSSCTITVGGDFVNNGSVTGPVGPGRGSWLVTGMTTNNNDFCMTGKCDMCDAGNPPGGFDVNTGNVGPSSWVTFCAPSQPCGPTSMPEASDENPVSLYPNPASSGTSISFQLMQPHQGMITISSITGKKMREMAFKGAAGTNTFSMSTNDLRCGIYFITISTGSWTTVQKLVIE